MKRNNTKKGFSIGEVMVAMFILIYGIVSAVFLTTNSVRQIGDSRNAVIAALLAQEGTELVKNVRDNSVTQETCGTNDAERCTSFKAFAGIPGSQGNSYGWPSYDSGGTSNYVIYFNEDIPFLSATGEDDNKLFINPSTGFYNHDTGDATPFKRRIYIKYYNIENGSRVTVPPTPTDIKDMIAEVASVVIWKNGTFPSDIDSIKSECKIGKSCAFTKTNLTSWINYGE